jgi:hypothetical protein
MSKLVVLLCFLLAYTLAQSAKSWSILSANSIVTTPSSQSSCIVGVSESFVFDFKGSYGKVGRPIKDWKAYKKVEIVPGSLRATITSPSGYTARASVQRNKEDDTTFIIVEFDPKTPQQGAQVAMKLEYQVDGPFSQENGFDQIVWDYKFDVDMRNVQTDFKIGQSVSDYSIEASPPSAVTQRSNSYIRFEKSFVNEFSESVRYRTLGRPVCVPKKPSPPAPTRSPAKPQGSSSFPTSNLTWIIPVSIICGIIFLILFVVCISKACSGGSSYTSVTYSEPVAYGTTFGTTAYTRPYISQPSSVFVSNTTFVDGDSGYHHHHHHDSGYGGYDTGYQASADVGISISGSSGFADGGGYDGGGYDGITGDSGFAD